jgi:hypothetical protein
MRFLQLFRNGYVIAFLAGLFCLCACDLDLFDSNFKEIAGGYRLKRVKGSQQFVFCLPRENGGAIIDEIGWRNPVILFRASGSQYWDRINTGHAQHIRISDADRKSEAALASIQIEPAEAAWNRLTPHKRLW